MSFSRKEGAGLIGLGVVFLVGSLLAAHFIEFSGKTWAGFYFGAALGGFMVILGLVALTGVLDKNR